MLGFMKGNQMTAIPDICADPRRRRKTAHISLSAPTAKKNSKIEKQFTQGGSRLPE